MRNLKLVVLIVCSIFIFSCSSNQEVDVIQYEKQALVMEGPIFEGSNTAQGKVENQLNQLLKSDGLTIEKLNGAKLIDFTLSLKDTGNFDGFSSMVIQFASEKTEMIEVATITKIPKGSKTLTFKISGTQEGMLDVLKQKYFTIVADGLATSETDDNILLLADMKFEIN